MAKRLTRARQKIQQAHIPYRVPPDHELPDRWAAVLATTYLLFNEGYAATCGTELVRARPRRRGDPARPPPGATAARRPGCARAAGADAAAGLAPRDPHRRRRAHRAARRPGPHARWDRAAIEEARRPGRRGAASHARAVPDRYVVQAAIAACHALAPTWRRDRLGRGRLLVRRAAHRRRRPGRAAQPRGRGGRARRRRTAGLALVDGDRRARGLRPVARHARRCCCAGSAARTEAAAADARAAALPLNDRSGRCSAE